MNRASLGWLGIVRLGLVQSAIGSIVVLTTSTFNRVMVVEMALPASLPAALVAWHYAVQLSRPRWGHGSDAGQSRTPLIVYGMGILALGAIIAANATVAMQNSPTFGILLGIVAFAMIGAGVSASGTSLLALMASRVTPDRRPAAASITWIMMIFGIVFTAGVGGAMLDPYSPQRLVLVASAVAGVAFVVTLLAVWGVESRLAAQQIEATEPASSFRETLREIWKEKLARDFTLFVFVSMLAYSAQELILEPFSGLVFGYSLGKSTQLAGFQHGGVLIGMVLVGLLGTLLRGDKTQWMKGSIVFGCVASALALAALAVAGFVRPMLPLQPVVFALGFSNGIFAVSAIGLMMSFAGAGRQSREGVRMGVWGAAQAIAFAIGGFAGAAGLDVMRHMIASTPTAFAIVFATEGVVFVGAALFATRLGRAQARTAMLPPGVAGSLQ
ncbi:MAG: BCD family MFS transporter [Proteobacteria bacterium]|nr:BCD family MFS transporter [Pseudomonadota bacterium]